MALSVLAFVALTACGADTERVTELEAQVEELKGQVSSMATTSTLATTSTSTTTSTTSTLATTSTSTTTTTEPGSWEVRFPGFEKLFGMEVPIETVAWCRARPEVVLATFVDIFKANSSEEHWQLAMSELEAFDYDVEAWRQDDKYDNGFWAWRSACESAERTANQIPVEIDPLLTMKITEEAALWCSVHPDEVLAAFATLHEANNTGQIDDLWTIAGIVLQQFNYDVDEWRQLDTFEVGFWAWRASCQVAYDSR